MITKPLADASFEITKGLNGSRGGLRGLTNHPKCFPEIKMIHSN